MKQIFKKYWAVIGFVVSFVLDSQYQILEKFITDPFWLNIVKGLGVLVVGYFTDKKLGFSKPAQELIEEEFTEEQRTVIEEVYIMLDSVGLEIAGGGIKNKTP